MTSVLCLSLLLSGVMPLVCLLLRVLLALGAQSVAAVTCVLAFCWLGQNLMVPPMWLSCPGPCWQTGAFCGGSNSYLSLVCVHGPFVSLFIKPPHYFSGALSDRVPSQTFENLSLRTLLLLSLMHF